MIAFQSASLISSIGRPTWPTTPPAQLTRTSTRPMPSTRAVTCRGSARSAVSRSTRWTFAPSSASPSAMAVPMPCADPVTSATLPASSAILGPAVLDEIPDLGDAGAPELEDLFVGPLVRASEDPVDGEPAQLLRRRLTDEGGGDPRLCTFWHDDARDARPGEVFHPRAVRGLLLVAFDNLPDARRVPPVVEEDLHARLARLGEPLAQRARRRRVPAVAVDDGDAAEALPVQRVEQVAQDRDVRARAQRRAAGERSEVRGHAERQRWEDRHPEWLGRLDRDALGQDRVGADRQIAVLLRRSDGHHDPVVVREIFLEHLPVAVVDPHERTSP